MLRTLSRVTLLATPPATPAPAECLTAAALQAGISFTRQDGSQGHIQTKTRVLAIDHITNKTGLHDRRAVVAGVFETAFTAQLSGAVLVAGPTPRRSDPSPV